jgi:hypothetical protein
MAQTMRWHHLGQPNALASSSLPHVIIHHRLVVGNEPINILVRFKKIENDRNNIHINKGPCWPA